jgi:hypothetical protein
MNNDNFSDLSPKIERQGNSWTVSMSEEDIAKFERICQQ